MMPDATQGSSFSAHPDPSGLAALPAAACPEVAQGAGDAADVDTEMLGLEPSAIVGSQFTFEQICAFGLAMGWGDRPLSFVVKNWMDSRPAFALEDYISLPR